jgi:hypothetical protein
MFEGNMFVHSNFDIFKDRENDLKYKCRTAATRRLCIKFF